MPPHPITHWKSGISSLSAILQASKAALGKNQRLHQNWFDENDDEIKKIPKEKNDVFLSWQNYKESTSKKDKFKYLEAKAQKQLCVLQDNWWEKKAEEIQHYANSNNTKLFYNSLKAIYGPLKSGPAPLKSSDGSILIKDKTGNSERCVPHY